MAKRKSAAPAKESATQTAAYTHPKAEAVIRPEIGTQAQFKKHKPPTQRRYDASLAPELAWDAGNPSRELGAWLLACIEESAKLPAPHQFPKPREFKDARGKVFARCAGLADAVAQMKAMEKPFLNWSGKAEHLSFEVPTLPLFIHERLSTKAIIEALADDKRKQTFHLFEQPEQTPGDSTLRAFEHGTQWQNRMVLGDSLVVMNSLLKYESMAGKVQMVYMDPPYGVKFGSNFQPFVRKRDVKHNDDEDFTREPEMVQAYRDTWELGLHSYLTYLRDRLKVARELLTESGSVFVQISDENLHHVREVMDEVFGGENFVSNISFRTKIPLGTKHLAGVADYLLWYAKDKEQMKFRRIFIDRESGGDTQFTLVELKNGDRRRMTEGERSGTDSLPFGARAFRLTDLVSTGRTETCVFDFEFEGKVFSPSGGKSWKTTKEGIKKLIAARRIMASGKMPAYVFYQDDYPIQEIGNLWADTQGASDKHYVVQTAEKVSQRCMLMTTDPGDLVLDPTCGSGTTAFVAEQWGRRWITMDTSRVPMALARQRLLTATYPWYQLLDETRGPAGGFIYKRKQNEKGQDVGGLVPHLTLGSITNNETPKLEILVDRPEPDKSITRITGPFTVEATIPTACGIEGEAQVPSNESFQASASRMLEVLRLSPILRLPGNQTVKFKNIRRPARALVLSAEALQINGEDKPVAFVFGPENGAISEKLIFEAGKEANMKGYQRLYCIGFAIEAKARETIDQMEAMTGIPAFYVQATPDLLMGDLLKNMRSSQIFSVCGQPDIAVKKSDGKWQVELKGLDVFDPVSMEVEHMKGADVPSWFLDTDYNGRVFRVSQAFFPRTGAWESLKKALKTTHRESVWDHLAGTESEPFEEGTHKQVAVKVIDDRGNELLVVKMLERAKEKKK